jgi:hypothetical protein
MSYDSLSGKTDEYVKDKGKHDDEVESFLEEKERFDVLLTEVGNLDDDIQSAIQDVSHDLNAERERLDDEKTVLDDRKKKLSDIINQELDKLSEANGRLESLSGKKYSDGASKAADKCKDYIGQLKEMLDQIDSVSSGDNLSISSANSLRESGVDSGFFGRKSNDNTSTSMSRYEPIIGNHTIETDLLATNPNYSTVDSNSPWNNNCQRCVSAYEARRRGYDVEAQPLPNGNDPLPIMRHPQGWPSVYKDGQLIDCSANSGTQAATNVELMMRSWGDNCRAIVRVRWKPEAGGGGHVFIAERTNGVTRFIDPQNGNTDASSYFQFAKGNDLFCMRIDNLDFTDRIHQCCQAK